MDYVWLGASGLKIDKLGVSSFIKWLASVVHIYKRGNTKNVDVRKNMCGCLGDMERKMCRYL